MAKTFCVLLPVLGITWLIGLVTFNKDIIELQYIFAIVNSLQVKRFSLYIVEYCKTNAMTENNKSKFLNNILLRAFHRDSSYFCFMWSSVKRYDYNIIICDLV
jgi:hypothetical protein